MYLRLTSSRIFTNALYINSEILITEIGVSNEAKNVGVLLLVFLFCQLYFTISHNYFLSLLNRELCLSNNFLFWQNRFLICQINFTLLLNHMNTERRKNTKISNEVRTYSYYQSNERWYSRLDYPKRTGRDLFRINEISVKTEMINKYYRNNCLLLVCTVVYHHQHYQEFSQLLLHRR
jgi:hypothetical protein